jgi:histidinol phosphatase-like PHP family hydrolase
MVKVLPDDLPTPGEPQEDADYERLLIDLGSRNFPLVDLHVHLKGGLTMEQAQAHARKYGFTHGYAVNCGLKMGYESEEALEEYLAGYHQPSDTWHAMQAEGREWVDLFSPEIISRFDYVFTDAMTWTNDDGKRMRLWIEEETEVGDPEDFMDQLVDRIVTILHNEPVDIYVNPTYLPDEIAGKYDELWTEERMDRVIQALVETGIALEINCRRMIPSPAFIKRAKAAGVVFTFGTNNGGADDLGRMEYALRMIGECGLTPGDIWLP